MPLVTVEELSAEMEAGGMAVPTDPAGLARLQRACAMAQTTIETYTGRWFEPREFTVDQPLKVTSVGGTSLFLPVPIIRLDSATEGDVPLDLSTLEWIAVDDPAGRPNRIFHPVLYKRPIPGYTFSGFEVYGGPGTRVGAITRPTWLSGRDMVLLTGSFGFVEPDGVSPPPEIKLAAMMIAMRWRSPVGSDDFRQQNWTAAATSESTDGHSYSISQGLLVSAGPTFDPLVDAIITKYKRRNAGGSTRGTTGS